MPLAIAPALVALFALIVLFVSEPIWYPALQRIFSQRPPIIGPTWGQIGGWVVGELDRFFGWARAQAGVIERALTQPVSSARGWNSSYANFTQATHGAIVHTRQVDIPQARQHSDQVAGQAQHNAQAYAQQAAAGAARHADQVGAGAEAYSRQLHAQETQFTQQLHAAETQFTQQLHQDAVRYAQQLSASDQQLSEQLHAQAVQYAAEVGRQAEAYAQELSRQLAAALASQGATLERYIEGVQAQDQDYARAAVTSAVGPLSLAQAATQTAVQELENSECQKFCNPLGQLGAAMQGIDLALILGLLAEAAAHPEVVRAELAAVGQQIDGLASEVKGLLGVA